MCKIIKTKNETLALVLRAQYVNEVWNKSQMPQNLPPLPVEFKVQVRQESP